MNAKRIVNTDPHSPVPADVVGILESVIEERDRAMQKWNVQNHPDGTSRDELVIQMREDQRMLVDVQAEQGRSNWYDILLEEVYEAGAEVDLVALDKELCQVMQVALVWREDIRRRMTKSIDALEQRVVEEEMRQLAREVCTLASPALKSLANGFFPGRQFLLDNILGLRVTSKGRSDEHLAALVKLDDWVRGLPNSWWDVNFRHDEAVAAALTNPLPSSAAGRISGSAEVVSGNGPVHGEGTYTQVNDIASA